jgi:hypothetical protein
MGPKLEESGFGLIKSLTASELEIIRELEDLVKLAPPIRPDSWAINSLPKIEKRQSRLWSIDDTQQAAVVEYEKDLAHWTRHLPPGITLPYIVQVNRGGMRSAIDGATILNQKISFTATPYT